LKHGIIAKMYFIVTKFLDDSQIKAEQYQKTRSYLLNRGDYVIVHLITGVLNSNYTTKFAKFVNQNFEKEAHVFIGITKNLALLDNVSKTGVKTFSVGSVREAKKVFSIFRRAEKIVIHSLFSISDVVWLLLNSRLLSKTVWVLWGGDLYNYWLQEKHSLKELTKEKLKRLVIKQLGGIATFVEGDYNLVREKYKTEARYFYTFYPNPVNFELLDNANSNTQIAHSGLRKVLLGNSATWTNNHFEILSALSRIDDKSFKIICPLSYGDSAYAEEVIKFGYELFGDRFAPLTQFLSSEEYAKVLASVDVAVFNHNRQQGLGNILALLYLGKKVYIRDDITTFEFFDKHGIRVYNTKDILKKPNVDIFEYNEEIGKRNRDVIATEFSEERCIELWRKVFYE